jgi:HSP20 family protein
MMDDFFNDAWPFGRNLVNDTFKVDVQETDGAYTIEADLPGIRKEEIHLSLDEGRLTIRVERNESVDEEKEHYVHRERRHTSMQRSLYMADAGEEDVGANLTDGVLKITVPKKAKPARAKDIEIN